VTKKSSTEKDKSIDKKDSGNSNKNKSVSKPKEKNGIAELQKFIKDSISELKKIQWPERKKVVGETIVVLITVVFMTTLVTFFDKLIAWALAFILAK